MSSRKWKMAAITGGVAALAFTGVAPVGAAEVTSARTAVVRPNYPAVCNVGDTKKQEEEIELAGGGAHAWGYLCEDHISHGYYWNIVVQDDKGDNKCAHAVADWLHKNGTHYYDYGTYVCGEGGSKAHTTAPRNPTLYSVTRLGVFVDDGPTTYAGYIGLP